MPLKDGRIVVLVKCQCGRETEVSSSTYGSYCLSCGRTIFSSNHLDELNEEIRKVVKEERLKIRKSKKNHTFTEIDYSVGGSSVISACFCCGGSLNAGQIYLVDGETVCKNCYENKVPKCNGCRTPHFKQFLNSLGLCEGCVESFVKCPSCGTTCDKRKSRPFTLEDGTTWCYNCVSRYLGAHHVMFQQYSYKPTPLMLGDMTATYRFGLEIEMDGSDRRYEFMARSHCDEIYYKPDGSLGPGGVEMVTHPATLEYHMTEFPWERILKAAKASGYRSHTGAGGGSQPTCGMHIHVSKKAFGRTSEEQDKREAKLVMLFDKFWKQLIIFSRRDLRSIERWARRYADIDSKSDNLSDIITKAKGENMHERGRAINFLPTNTVEFRLFRGTLNRETVLASIQLLELFIKATKLPTNKIHELTWDEFCDDGCEKYDEFKGYISRLRSMKKGI